MSDFSLRRARQNATHLDDRQFETQIDLGRGCSREEISERHIMRKKVPLKKFDEILNFGPVMSQNDSDSHRSETEGGTSTIQKPKVTRPPLYQVVLLNDDYTPMDFVILVLKSFFRKDETEAQKLMMQVHTQGAAVAGVYTFEVAETKVFQVNEFSRRHRHPLKCTMSREE